MEIYGLCAKNKRLSIYKINSIEWDGEEYKDNGILCRNAVAKGNKVVNDYTALYGGDAYLPANNLAYKYVATYTADVTEPDAATIYDITATAIILKKKTDE